MADASDVGKQNAWATMLDNVVRRNNVQLTHHDDSLSQLKGKSQPADEINHIQFLVAMPPFAARVRAAAFTQIKRLTSLLQTISSWMNGIVQSYRDNSQRWTVQDMSKQLLEFYDVRQSHSHHMRLITVPRARGLSCRT